MGGGTCLLVACSSDRQLQLIRLADQREATIRESEPVTSICASRDGDYLLTSTNSHTVHLWPLGNLRHSKQVRCSAARGQGFTAWEVCACVCLWGGWVVWGVGAAGAWSHYSCYVLHCPF